MTAAQTTLHVAHRSAIPVVQFAKILVFALIRPALPQKKLKFVAAELLKTTDIIRVFEAFVGFVVGRYVKLLASRLFVRSLFELFQ